MSNQACPHCQESVSAIRMNKHLQAHMKLFVLRAEERKVPSEPIERLVRMQEMIGAPPTNHPDRDGSVLVCQVYLISKDVAGKKKFESYHRTLICKMVDTHISRGMYHILSRAVEGALYSFMIRPMAALGCQYRTNLLDETTSCHDTFAGRIRVMKVFGKDDYGDALDFGHVNAPLGTKSTAEMDAIFDQFEGGRS